MSKNKYLVDMRRGFTTHSLFGHLWVFLAFKNSKWFMPMVPACQLSSDESLFVEDQVRAIFQGWA